MGTAGWPGGLCSQWPGVLGTQAISGCGPSFKKVLAMIDLERIGIFFSTFIPIKVTYCHT